MYNIHIRIYVHACIHLVLNLSDNVGHHWTLERFSKAIYNCLYICTHILVCMLYCNICTIVISIIIQITKYLFSVHDINNFLYVVSFLYCLIVIFKTLCNKKIYGYILVFTFSLNLKQNN